MNLIEPLAVAVSLCADCFAVSLCSGITLRKVRTADILKVAVAFAVIQSGLLLIGSIFGRCIAGFVETAAHILGFLLLAYVGGSMLLEGIRGKSEARDLNGWKNIILGGIATSIDALAVGIAQSISRTGSGTEIFILPAAVFVVTAISVIGGLKGGHAIGASCGRWAEIAGGAVLIAIGITILLQP